MNKNINEKLKRAYWFMEQVYPANWQTRWGRTPYMKSFAQQSDVNKFIKSKGKFESVPGHVWACIGFWMQLRQACPSLDKLIDSEEVYERLWVNDIGETYQGDISYAVKIYTSLEEGKSEERSDFIKLTKGLSKRVRQRLLRWHDEFEKKESLGLPLEAMITRWVDSLEGDHFALTFGNSLKEYSDTIEKIVKKRSAERAKAIIDYLFKKAKGVKESKNLYEKAIGEVGEVMRFHTRLIRKKGIKLDLSELGF